MPESDAAECHRPMKKIASAFLLEGWREGHVMHVMTACSAQSKLRQSHSATRAEGGL